MTAQPSFEVFFDGDCPLCRREIEFLQRRDRAGAIRFTDIAAPDFEPGSFGMTMDDFMTQIRGRMPDGRFVAGIEVFRQLYAAVGFGLIVRITRMPDLSHLMDLAHRWFARNRLGLTGRCNADVCSTPG